MFKRVLFLLFLFGFCPFAQAQELLGRWQMKEVSSKIRQDDYSFLDTAFRVTPGTAILEIKKNSISYTYTEGKKKDRYSRKIKFEHANLIEMPTTIYAMGEFSPRDFLFFGNYTVVNCSAKELLLELTVEAPPEPVRRPSTVHRILFERLPDKK